MKALAGHNRIQTASMTAVLLLLMMIGTVRTASPASVSLEYRLKTAFIYNFTRFIEWPPSSEQIPPEPFRIGFLGADVFGEEIDGLVGKMVGDRPLSIQRYPIWDDHAAECEILFIAGSENERLPEVLHQLNGKPVLTVGDTKPYAARGVMINFFMENNKVRFKINLKKARESGFKISSRLLKLAAVLE
jgi:YfiR/HmsC-like